MTHLFFARPVRVMVDPRGVTADVVSNVRRAAELLLEDWPAGGGTALTAAKEGDLYTSVTRQPRASFDHYGVGNGRDNFYRSVKDCLGTP